MNYLIFPTSRFHWKHSGTHQKSEPIWWVPSHSLRNNSLEGRKHTHRTVLSPSSQWKKFSEILFQKQVSPPKHHMPVYLNIRNCILEYILPSAVAAMFIFCNITKAIWVTVGNKKKNNKEHCVGHRPLCPSKEELKLIKMAVSSCNFLNDAISLLSMTCGFLCSQNMIWRYC